MPLNDEEFENLVGEVEGMKDKCPLAEAMVSLLVGEGYKPDDIWEAIKVVGGFYHADEEFSE